MLIIAKTDATLQSSFVSSNRILPFVYTSSGIIVELHNHIKNFRTLDSFF